MPSGVETPQAGGGLDRLRRMAAAQKVNPNAVAGMAAPVMLRRKLSFEWRWNEIGSYDTDVNTAIKDFDVHRGSLKDARTDVLSKMIGDVADGFEGELSALDKRLDAMEKGQVTLDKRASVVKAVADIEIEITTLIRLGKQQLQDAKDKREVDEKAELQRKADELAAAKLKAEQDADAQRKADEKAAAQKKADEEAAAKRKTDEEAETKRQADEAEAKRIADEQAEAKRQADEAEAKRVAAEQAEAKRVADEKARRDAFGANQGAFDVATGLATSISGAEHQPRIDKLESDLLAATPKQGKKKAKGWSPKPVADTVDPALALAEQEYETGKAAAESLRVSSAASIVTNLGGVASSAAGQLLKPDDLTWAMSASKGSAALAKALVDLGAMGPEALGVAKQIGSRPYALALAPICGNLLTDGVPPSLLPDAAELVQDGGGAFRTWLVSCVPTEVATAVQLASTYSKSLKLLATVATVLGVGARTETVMNLLKSNKVTAMEIATFIGLQTHQGFDRLCRVIENRAVAISDVCKVITPASLNRFTFDELVQLCDRRPKNLADVAQLVLITEPHCPTYVGLLIETGQMAFGNAKLCSALRAEGLLTDAPPNPLLVAQQQADVVYVGGAKFQARNQANDARTGFVELTFPDGTTADIHTHWDAKGTLKGKVVSMHVQAGGNGLELNEWKPFFPRLAAAVVAAQNVGNPAPKGGPLSLALT